MDAASMGITQTQVTCRTGRAQVFKPDSLSMQIAMPSYTMHITECAERLLLIIQCGDYAMHFPLCKDNCLILPGITKISLFLHHTVAGQLTVIPSPLCLTRAWA